MGKISSQVVTEKCSLFVAAFRSLGSKHSLNDPPFCSTISQLFTHSVGSSFFNDSTFDQTSNLFLNFG